ncbi:MAG: AAA family ATPase [Caldilineaceae bacterium]|nr:AAA family ATPase [Defluviicoccus sp.]MDE0336459.1 AAA family ATPase [Caldilineaceae bacterium]
MKSFPVFRLLEVNHFGLYPGLEDSPGHLRVAFFPGLTLVVGANGLGKTTLITMLFRMITGPFDIPQLRAGDELGFRRLEATRLPRHQRNMFAARVSDHASNATARLAFDLGSSAVTVERKLSNLSLVSATVDDTECKSESAYQDAVSSAVGVGSFGDLILMLRYLVFYFEDRRQLVWDASAQRQLLRMLFLPPDIAQRWTAMERSILENDSRMRNFQAVVGREERHLTAALAKRSDAPALRAELQALESLQEPDRNRLEELESTTDELDRTRQDARLAHLRAKQEREARFRALEHAKLLAIDARFPGKLETGRYMLAHLLSENSCLVCGSEAPTAAQDYADRLKNDRCVVCDTPLEKSVHIVETRDVADERVSKAERLLVAADRSLLAATHERERSESEFSHHTTEIAHRHAAVAKRAARLSEIIELLPPSEAALRKQRTELASVRGRLETMKAELAEERSKFHSFVEQCTDDLLSSSEEIVEAFATFSGNFLSEETSLTWATRSATVGQGGQAIPFPAFELNMSGSDFVQTVRRAGPDDVSESQREFIDLSFRMALMTTAGSAASGLVVDTPESSLDAVFAKRAGDTLVRFGERDGNTVIVTSNLIEGSLLPTLIDGLSVTPEKADRLVDLFEVAHPTAAVSSNQDEYDALRHKLFAPLS